MQHCIATNDLTTFQKELNTHLKRGWKVVPGTMYGFGMSHEMAKGARPEHRYTQANFLCVVELSEDTDSSSTTS